MKLEKKTQCQTSKQLWLITCIELLLAVIHYFVYVCICVKKLTKSRSAFSSSFSKKTFLLYALPSPVVLWKPVSTILLEKLNEINLRESEHVKIQCSFFCLSYQSSIFLCYQKPNPQINDCQSVKQRLTSPVVECASLKSDFFACMIFAT